tara:strand:- start:1907 stop:3694 length:1788 start_codon:yes stop_codon:yes gene_type:complete
MCGFVGFNYLNKEVLKKALNEINHRGPDGSNIILSNGFSIGHNLLSIRGDISKSIQPISNINSKWILVFNGQIYNLKELKMKLDQEYKIEEIDTIILYEIINRFGWNFIDHIEGMFSIALLNKDTSEIRLYRDESGQKPLYYSQVENNFFFASEIKSLLSLGVNKDIDQNAISYFCHLGYIPGKKTIFKNIKKVLPGQVLGFTESKGLYTSCFTNLSEKSHNKYSFDCLRQDMISLVDDHLQSKTKISLNLSGGMDSSSLLWAAKQSNKKVTAITTFFKDGLEKYNEEAKLAKELCKTLNVDHEILEISNIDYLDNFISSYESIEEPNGNNDLPLYFLMAKKHKYENNTVIISGDGGDETWGGYSYHHMSLKHDSKMFPMNKYKFQNIFLRKAFLNVNNPVDRYLYYRSLIPAFTKNKINSLKKYLKKEFNFLFQNSNFKNLSKTQQMFVIERACWLSEENFLRSDKIYMSQSLEVRSPFADRSFRNSFTRKFSSSDLWADGYSKAPLRDSLDGYLPDSINRRKRKVGWHSPIDDSWYKKDIKSLMLDLFDRDDTEAIDWKNLRNFVLKTEKYPGKFVNYYASLAIIGNLYNIDL